MESSGSKTAWDRAEGLLPGQLPVDGLFDDVLFFQWSGVVSQGDASSLVSRETKPVSALCWFGEKGGAEGFVQIAFLHQLVKNFLEPRENVSLFRRSVVLGSA